MFEQPIPSRLSSLALLLLTALSPATAQDSATDTIRQGSLGPVNLAPSETPHVPGRLLVRFADDVLDHETLQREQKSFGVFELVRHADVRDALVASGVTDMRRVVSKLRPEHVVSKSRSGKTVVIPSLLNLMIVEMDSSADLQRERHRLKGLDGVLYAELDHLHTANDTPNDPEYFRQRGFEQADDRDIDADRAWDFQTGSYSVKVGVIDSGIDYHHEDLGDGDFGFEGAKVRGGWDFFNNDSDPDDDRPNSHGTAVAGIIGAERNNGIGVAGLAGGNGTTSIGVQLFAFKVGGTDQSFTTSHVIDAIVEASVWTPSFGYGVHVLNYSGGGYDYNEAYRDALRVAAENDVVFVTSKGNDDTDNRHYPSDYDGPWVLSVGASNAQDNKSGFSNFGNGIDVIAPAFCTAGSGTDNITHTTRRNDTYSCFSGTSAAAPHVAGLAALLKSENFTLQPEEIEGIIRVTADHVPAMNGQGYTDDHGDGRINAGDALERLNAPWELERRSVRGGAITSSTGFYNTVFYNPGGGLASAAYTVKRHEVRKTVTIDDYETFDVFCRGPGDTIGWSAASPNYQVGHCDVVAQTANSVTLRTWVYEVYSILGQYIGYRPATPQNVRFAYTISGIPAPPGPEPPQACFTVTPTFGSAPLVVTVNASCTTDPDSSSLSYSWSMGDGSLRFGTSFNHTYLDPGSYSIQLTVTDDTGQSDTALNFVAVQCESTNGPFLCLADIE